MNTQMAYLIGMILGNGEIQRDNNYTTVTIDIPHKKLEIDDCKDVPIYVKASIIDIKGVIEPLIGEGLIVSQAKTSTRMTFTKRNEDYTMREIMRFIGGGVQHKTMVMNEELFGINTDEKKELLRGFADVTGHIRRSNQAFGQKGQHRVYIEIPVNWQMVIDLANMLKDLDIPVQSIDFGHPNFRDAKREKYDSGNHDFWKKEHQLKIWANEFLPVGFNITHKQKALQKYANELLKTMDPKTTHKFYWEKQIRYRHKPSHPGENDPFLPECIRGKHFDSWTDLAAELGYHE